MIICAYCKTQLPGHSFFCYQCGKKVSLPDETLVMVSIGPVLKSALRQKNQATVHYVEQGLPHEARPAPRLLQMYRSGAFNQPGVAENDANAMWKDGEDGELEDDVWL